MDSRKSFGPGFFKSLTSSFKSPNSDREKIDSSSITDDKAKQELIDDLKRGSSSQRVKAAESLADSLYEISPSHIKDVWYCAKDMISPNAQHQSRHAGLKLLKQCVSMPSDDPEPRYMYFSDALVNCHFTKDKIDIEFSQFLQIIKLLTDNGYFIHHYQESFKKPLLEWYTNALAPTEMAKNRVVLDLFSFINDCIKAGVFNIDDHEESTRLTKDLLTNTNKLALKTSDKEILEACIQLMDNVISNQTIPDSMFYETLEIVCGAAVLDLHYFDLGTSVVMNLINKTEVTVVFSTILDIIVCKQKKGDKNLNSSVGAINVMGFLFPKFAYQISTHSLLKALTEAVSWNKPNVNIAVIRFINETMLDGMTLDQIGSKYWDFGQDASILSLLSDLSSNLSKDEDVEAYKLVLVQLQHLAEQSRYPGSMKVLIDFFIKNSKFLSAKGCLDVLRYYSVENLCSPLNPDWSANLDMILSTFFYDETKDLTVRIACVKLVLDVFNSTLLVKENDSTSMQVAQILIKQLSLESSTEVIRVFTEHLTSTLIHVPTPLFQTLVSDVFLPKMVGVQQKQRRSSLSVLSPSNTDGILFSDNTAIEVTKAFITMFATCLASDGRKAQITYVFLMDVAEYALAKKNVDLLLITAKLFSRIRSSSTKQVYLTMPTDIEGLSAAFGRNLNLRKVKETTIANLTLDEKWTYPEEIDYIPDDTLDKPSASLTIIDNTSDKLVTTPAIDIERWLSIVIQILKDCPHWEVYSFTYTHFCPQLSNISLFESCGDGIRSFRSLVCEQLQLKLPSTVKIPSNMSRQDLQVAIVRNFTPLISYHGIFSKQDEDEIISALLVGLSSWEKTAIPCIHILTVCCYELPLSIKKYISAILTKLQTRISSAFASAHILEFLLSLSYIPSLTSNFTVDEFKRAFGITFKLIQYAHDMSETKENQHQGILAHGAELAADVMPSTESLEITPVVSIYLLSISYDVIANWFLNMKLNDRRKLSSFIIKNLILSQSNRGSEVNNQNMSFLDLITRFTYSDLELNFSPIKPRKFADDVHILSSKWVYGNSIVGVDTDSVSGESIISVRRASGSSVFTIKPDESMIPVYTDQLHSKEDDDVFTASYVFLQLMVHPDQNNNVKPIPIPDEASFTRSISNFDRIPVVGFHKIGLLYIGPNQTTEKEVLSNDSCSVEFTKFLKKLGRPITLKGCKSFYVGGLDTENDTDGEIAYGWNDKILQLIFHTTTLMPSSSEDPNNTAKKRHIGNNYVNIFFDDSGHPFDFNIIKSQFNFLNIVIQPHSISFDNDANTDDHIKKYKVKVHRRAGVPGLFATCHFKIISEENLPTFVRTLALVADQFAQVWHSNGNYASNWSHRMRQILQIKEKALKTHQELKSQLHDESRKSEQNSNSGQGFLSQISSGDGLRRSNSTTRPTNTNQYEFTDDDDNEIFKNMEFNSFTK